MTNRNIFQKSVPALALALALTVAAPGPAAAQSGEGSPWSGAWGWLSGLWDSAVAAVTTSQDQGAGLDPNG